MHQPGPQDSWAIKERLGGQDLMLFGVFDGHGAEGKAVSHTITTKLPKLLANSPHLKVSPEAPCSLFAS